MTGNRPGMQHQWLLNEQLTVNSRRGIAQEQERESLTRLVRELTAARAKAASARHHLQVCSLADASLRCAWLQGPGVHYMDCGQRTMEMPLMLYEELMQTFNTQAARLRLCQH